MKGNFLRSYAERVFSNPRNEVGDLKAYMTDIEVNEGNFETVVPGEVILPLSVRFVTYQNNLSLIFEITKAAFLSDYKSLFIEFNSLINGFDDAPGITFLFNRYALFRESGEIPQYESEDDLLRHRLDNGNLQLGTNTIYIDNLWGCKFRSEIDMSHPDSPEDNVLNQLRRKFPYYATL